MNGSGLVGRITVHVNDVVIHSSGRCGSVVDLNKVGLIYPRVSRLSPINRRGKPGADNSVAVNIESSLGCRADWLCSFALPP